MPGERSPSEPAPGTADRQFAEDPTDESSDRLSLFGTFYRGEMERTVGWRTRLDQTTNWAVVLMAAILTFSFSSEENPHYVLLIGVLGVLAFLVIESQRYQEYDSWRYRVRLLQRHVFADVADRTVRTRATGARNWATISGCRRSRYRAGERSATGSSASISSWRRC